MLHRIEKKIGKMRSVSFQFSGFVSMECEKKIDGRLAAGFSIKTTSQNAHTRTLTMGCCFFPYSYVGLRAAAKKKRKQS